MNGEVEAILIAGPTASGKSQLAMELAERHRGAVVNADSLQVYDGLEILTARPSKSELERVPHRLYGHVDPHVAYSAGTYRREVEAVIADLRQKELMPIVCGGSGLYFKALLGLLDEMPDVPADVRTRWRERLARDGPEALHGLLGEQDPQTAERLDPRDGQRIVRALEIVEAGGQPLSRLQKGGGEAIVDPARTRMLVLTPDRATLRQRIAKRFDVMLERGAIDEVARFRTRYGTAASTAGKAIGVSELSEVLQGFSTLETARERAIARSRQYAKRQETWFRHQFDARWRRVDPANFSIFDGSALRAQ